MTNTQTLQADLEAAASALGLSPSTLGEKCGQGGQFYNRLVQGKRVWPETARKVRERIEALKSAKNCDDEGGCDNSHGGNDTPVQGGVAEKAQGGAA